MALSFPLSREQFFQTLKVSEVTFRDTLPIETTQLADGTVIKASLGAALWRGTVKLAPAYSTDAVAVEAYLSLLQRPGATFFVFDPRRIGPKADPDGTALASAAPQIASINANNRDIALSGLPAGFVISPGDMLSFAYGSSPTRYALHRVVVGATANGSGTTGQFEVSPMIRTGASAGTNVTLVRPYCKAMMTGDPDYGTGGPLISNGASFDFIQTLR